VAARLGTGVRVIKGLLTRQHSFISRSCGRVNELIAACKDGLFSPHVQSVCRPASPPPASMAVSDLTTAQYAVFSSNQPSL